MKVLLALLLIASCGKKKVNRQINVTKRVPVYTRPLPPVGFDLNCTKTVSGLTTSLNCRGVREKCLFTFSTYAHTHFCWRY